MIHSSLKRSMLAQCVLSLTVGLGAGAAARADNGPPPMVANDLGPQQLVENSAKKMLAELDANRPMYAKDPAKLDNLVATVLLPNFDSEYSARLVLGQTWRTATPEQRKRFVDAFYHSLLRNYGAALLDFTADRFVILPYRGDPGETTATVRTEVKRSNGETVPVNFSLHKTDAGWKAWDVVIEGISYVKSFRTDFAAEIQQKGLDEVINRLETDGKVRAQQRRDRNRELSNAGNSGNAEASFEVLAGERARVEGSLDFATVAHLLQKGSAAIGAGRAAVIDLGGVTDSDSSGLALLIEWLSVAKQAGRALTYENMPAQLTQIARLSEVEALVSPAAAPAVA